MEIDQSQYHPITCFRQIISILPIIRKYKATIDVLKNGTILQKASEIDWSAACWTTMIFSRKKKKKKKKEFFCGKKNTVIIWGYMDI